MVWIFIYFFRVITYVEQVADEVGFYDKWLDIRRIAAIFIDHADAQQLQLVEAGAAELFFGGTPALIVVNVADHRENAAYLAGRDFVFFILILGHNRLRFADVIRRKGLRFQLFLVIILAVAAVPVVPVAVAAVAVVAAVPVVPVAVAAIAAITATVAAGIIVVIICHDFPSSLLLAAGFSDGIHINEYR